VRQEVTWPVRDHRGDTLPLRLPYERWKAERLDNLESWVASGSTVAGIVAHLDRDGAGALLEPVTILVERDDRPHPVSLDFERGPGRCTVRCWHWAWIRWPGCSHVISPALTLPQHCGWRMPHKHVRLSIPRSCNRIDKGRDRTA